MIVGRLRRPRPTIGAVPLKRRKNAAYSARHASCRLTSPAGCGAPTHQSASLGTLYAGAQSDIPHTRRTLLDTGAISTRRLPSKVVRVPVRRSPALATASIHSSSADRNRSAGAPARRRKIGLRPKTSYPSHCRIYVEPTGATSLMFYLLAAPPGAAVADPGRRLRAAIAASSISAV